MGSSESFQYNIVEIENEAKNKYAEIAWDSNLPKNANLPPLFVKACIGVIINHVNDAMDPFRRQVRQAFSIPGNFEMWQESTTFEDFTKTRIMVEQSNNENNVNVITMLVRSKDDDRYEGGLLKSYNPEISVGDGRYISDIFSNISLDNLLGYISRFATEQPEGTLQRLVNNALPTQMRYSFWQELSEHLNQKS